MGCGGFGEIYLCHEKDNPSKQYVMKVDNHNGPLYVEINFFIRAFSKNNVKNFMEEKGLEYLGIPRFIAFGTDKTANGDYRYLVMELLGEELQSVLETHRLSISVTSRIACRILGMLLFSPHIYALKTNNFSFQIPLSSFTSKATFTRTLKLRTFFG